jgi:CBS domain-containing protein
LKPVIFQERFWRLIVLFIVKKIFTARILHIMILGRSFILNIAFFLIPKNEVVYLSNKCTMRQALEKMGFYRYTAIPLIDGQGRYAGTLTEGDLLWKLINTPGLNFEGT